MERQKTYTLITGGSTGIGLELAKCFAKDGHNLIIAGRHEAELSKAAAELRDIGNIDVITMSEDLFDMEEGKQLQEEITARNLVVDTLVKNAGHGGYGELK